MEPKKHTARNLALLGVLLAALVAIAFTLARNKSAINASNKAVDLSQVPVAVTVTPVARGPADVKTRFPATLRPFEEANVAAQLSGIISELPVELGQRVSKGQLIGKMDTRILQINLQTARVGLRAAEVNKAKLLADYERAKELFANKAGLEVNVFNAKASYDNAVGTADNAALQIGLIQQQLANARLLAPIAGIVSAKNAKAGEFVNPGALLATITNIDQLKASVFLDQSSVYKLTAGQMGQVASAVFPEARLRGQIIYISPKADVNHNYQVDLRVANSEAKTLKAGTDVTVAFSTAPGREALLIPAAALVADRKEPFVFTAREGRAVGKTIRTGVLLGDKVEVLAGLAEAESVVTSGQINLREGSRLSIVN